MASSFTLAINTQSCLLRPLVVWIVGIKYFTARIIFMCICMYQYILPFNNLGSCQKHSGFAHVIDVIKYYILIDVYMAYTHRYLYGRFILPSIKTCS
jgi:hypothetical protein